MNAAIRTTGASLAIFAAGAIVGALIEA